MTAAWLLAAASLSVTQVTVYGDRARVVHEGPVPVPENGRVDLGVLPESADPSSVRVELDGAQLQKVDLAHVEPDALPVDRARQLLAELDRPDDRIAAARGEQAAVRAQLASLGKLVPQLVPAPLEKPPRLDPRGWSGALELAQARDQQLRERAATLLEQLRDLIQERARVAEQARLVGGAGRRSGWRITASVAGQGTAKARIVYVARKARWTPAYELQLQPDQRTLKLAFSGVASQETGEDWSGARLTLSTAVPATFRTLPEIATWKIGEKERFIPQPVPARPPQPPRPLPRPVDVGGEPARSEAQALREALLARAEEAPAVQPAEDEDEGGSGVVSGVVGGVAASEEPAELAAGPRPPIAVQSPPGLSKEQMSMVPYGRATRNAEAAKPAAKRGAAVPPPSDEGVGLAPPSSWRPEPIPPDSPAALAGGYDLEFASVRPESLRSGGGARRVLLLSESWPVQVERVLYPALSPDAYLVGRLKNPSRRTLPGGKADLAVGGDPSGSAAVPLLAPDAELTLPLGLDRALKPIRNVAQVETERGLFSKDEITRYTVTIEVANPHRAPVDLRIVDQVPRAGDAHASIALIEAKGAERDEATGKLTWKLTVPAQQKAQVRFVYDFKRPKGFKVHQ